MNKESKYYITIEKSNDSSFFKVELKDHYGSYNSVYEKTIDEAGWTPESMRVFDVGYIKAFEAVLREIQNKYE